VALPFELVRVWRAAITLTIVLAFLVLGGLKVAEQYLLRPLFVGLAALLHKVWFVGGTLSKGVLAVEHTIAHWLAAGTLATEGPVVNLLNGLAAVVATLALTLYYIGLEAYKGLSALWHVSVPAFTHAVVRPVARIAHGAVAVEHALERELHRDFGLARRYTHAVELEAAHALRAALHALRHSVAVGLERPLHWTEREVRAAEAEIARLWRLVRHGTIALPLALAGAFVLSALRRFGLGWLRCSNVNRVGRALCGFPVQLFEELLAAAVDAFVVTDLCLIVGLMTSAARALAGVFDEITATISGLISCTGSDRPGPLAVASEAPPPAAGLVTLSGLP